MRVGGTTFRVTVPEEADFARCFEPTEVQNLMYPDEPPGVKIAAWLALAVQSVDARDDSALVDWPVQGERWERCRDEARRLRRLHHPPAVAKSLAQAAGRLTPIDAAVVFFLEGGDLVRAAEADHSTGPGEVQVEQALLDRALHTARVASDERPQRHLLAVPLVREEKTRVVLYVSAPARLDREDCLLLFALVTAAEQGLELR